MSQKTPPELRQVLDQFPIDDRVCIGCGCTQLTPCLGGCHWTTEDFGDGHGLCSACAVIPLEELIRRGRGIFEGIR